MSDRQTQVIRLVDGGYVRKPTAAVLFERVDSENVTDPKFLSKREYEILVSLVGCLRPPHADRPTPLQIASCIDVRLDEGTGDGWRYANMPGDGIAHKRGLECLDQEAIKIFSEAFSKIESSEANSLIHRLQRGSCSIEWPFPADRFIEEVLAEVVTVAYSHPAVQESIGYVGYADAKGWTRIGLGQKEEWES